MLHVLTILKGGGSRMRFSLLGFILGCLLAVLTSWAPARSADTQPVLPEQYSQCEGLHDAYRYKASLVACSQAAYVLDRMAATDANPWNLYIKKAETMEIEALDYSALGKHREALRWAIGSHQLAFYVYRSYTLDPNDYSDINDLIQRLRRIEAYERMLSIAAKPTAEPVRTPGKRGV
jgi:hypothetical protein